MIRAKIKKKFGTTLLETLISSPLCGGTRGLKNVCRFPWSQANLPNKRHIYAKIKMGPQVNTQQSDDQRQSQSVTAFLPRKCSVRTSLCTTTILWGGTITSNTYLQYCSVPVKLEPAAAGWVVPSPPKSGVIVGGEHLLEWVWVLLLLLLLLDPFSAVVSGAHQVACNTAVLVGSTQKEVCTTRRPKWRFPFKPLLHTRSSSRISTAVRG